MTKSDSLIDASMITAADPAQFTGTMVANLNLSWEENHPRYIRQVQYPDGRIELQGGYVFGSAFEQGMKWKALPLVQVNEQGEAV